jgi:hypothetical protein
LHTPNPRQITISVVLRIGLEVHHIEVVGVHSDPGMDGSLRVREGRHRYCHTNHLSVQHCAVLGSADVVAAKGCLKEGPRRHILNLLDSLEAAEIVARKGPLGGLRRYPDAEYLQMAVVGCLGVRHKVAVGCLKGHHMAVAG